MTQESFSKKQFQQLFESRFDDLMAFVSSYVKDREVAKDIIQDAFFTLWKNRKIIDISQSPKSYLYKMARNYALNYLRHQKVVTGNEHLLTYNTMQIEQDLETYEKNLANLTAYIQTLPDKQRQVLEQCFVEGMSYKEIADELHISVNTVKTHLKRAINYLRDLMKDDLVLLFFIKKYQIKCKIMRNDVSDVITR